MAFDRLKYRITADASDFKRELRKAGDEFSRFTRKNRYAIRDMKDAFAGAATAVAAVGAALAGNALRATAQFEQSISSAGAKTGATVEEMYALRDAAREAGASTMFSAREAADGLGFLAQAGFDVQEQIQALPGLLSLAAAGELELAEAADIASNVLSGFGLEVAELGRVNDVLAKTASSSNTNVQQLGQALSYAAPVAAALGIDIEEAAAAVGTLSNAGIQATRAGTSLNGMMAQLQKAAGDLGVELTSAEIQSLGLAGSLAKLEAAGLTGANAMEYFGREAGPGVAALLSAGTESIAQFTGEIEKAEGAAQAMSDRINDNLLGDFRALTSALGKLNLVFGDVFGSASREGVQQLTELAREAGDSSEAFRAMRDDILDLLETTRTAVKVFTVVAGTIRVIGAVLQTVIGLFQAIVGPIGAAVETLNAMVLALRALGAASAGQWKTVDNLMNRSNAAMEDATRLYNKGVEGIADIGGAWQDAMSDVEDYRSMMQTVNRELANFEDRARQASSYADFLQDNDGVTYTPAPGYAGPQSMLPEGESVFGGPANMSMPGQPQVPAPDTTDTNAAASSTRALTDEVQQFADRMRDAAATPMQKYLDQLDLLKQANERGIIVGDEYGQVLDHIRAKYDPVTKAANELREEAERLKDSLKTDEQKLTEGLAQLKEMLDENLISTEQYKRAKQELRLQLDDSAKAAARLRERADELKESLRSAADVARERRDDIRKMFDAGLLSNQQYLRALGREGAPGLARLDEGDAGELDAQLSRLKQQAEESKRLADEWTAVWEDAGRQIADTISRSVGDVFLGLLEGKVDDVKESLKQLSAELIKIAARAVILSAVNSAAGGSGGASRFASGGYVSGPGTSTSDSIPAYLSNGEYVLQASAVRQVGKPFLDGLNQGRFDATPQRFAAGGLVQGGGGGGGNGDVYVGVLGTEELFEQFLMSSRGSATMLNVAEQNSDQFNAVLSRRK